LGLTVFVRHLVTLVKQVLIVCSQGEKLSLFLSLTTMPSDTPSLLKKNMYLTRYIGGQKSTSSRVPVYVSTGILPLASTLPNYLAPLTSFHRTLLLQLIPRGDVTHIHFRLSELKEIKIF
jgi:hypothetical protein